MKTMRAGCEITRPWWLIVIIVLETLPMFLGPIVAFNLPGFMGGKGAEELNQATYIYTARNVAVGIALLLGWWLRNAPMLFVLILIRLITDLVDLPTILAFDLSQNPPLLIGIFMTLYYIPAVIALVYLWRVMTQQPAKPAATAPE